MDPSSPKPALSLTRVLRQSGETARAIRPVLFVAWLCSTLPPVLWSIFGPPGLPTDLRRDQLVELLFALTGGLLATGAVYQAARGAQIGQPLGIGTAFGRGLRSWGTLLGTMFVAELQVLVVALLGIAPAAGLIYWITGGGPWMGLSLIFGIPALLRLVSLAVVVPQALFDSAYAFPESTRLTGDHRGPLLVPTLLYLGLSAVSLVIGAGIEEVETMLGVQLPWVGALLEAGFQSTLELGFDLFTLMLWVELRRLHPPTVSDATTASALLR